MTIYDGLIDSVRSMDPVQLRRHSLKGSGFEPAHGYDAELADRKAESSLRRLMEMERRNCSTPG